MTKLRLLLSAAALLAGLGAGNARGGTFTFSFSGPQDSGSGVFTAVPTATPNLFLVTAVTGTTDGLSITGLLAPGVYPVNLAVNDDILQMPPAGPGFFDLQGVSYQLANGLDINLYYGQFATGDPIGYNLVSGVAENNDLLNRVVVTAVGPSATPEPSSIVLFGTSAIGLGLAGLQKRLNRRSV